VPVAGAGIVSNVRLLNVQGTTTDTDELEFLLRSPANSGDALLIDNRCSGDDNWAFDLDDAASSSVTDGSFCSGSGPIGASIDNAWRAESPLSTFFDGQQAQGAWSLRINDTDSGGTDAPTLTAWSIEVCTSTTSSLREIRGGSYNDVEAGRMCDFDFEVAATTFRFPTTGYRCCWYPASGAP
jgi:hypothetical protein